MAELQSDSVETRDIELPMPPSAQRGAESVSEPLRVTGMLTGSLVGFTSSGEPLVLFDGSPLHSSVVAGSCVYLERGHVGRAVVLFLDGNDVCRPIIMGVVLASPLRHAREPRADCHQTLPPEHVELDGERLTLTAGREIALTCGEASLTLTRTGKIVLRGSYLLSRATRVNAIKGGSVEIN